MANPEHIERLKQGVNAWNDWRERKTEVWPDLSHIDLSGANLRGTNLRGVDLRGADLSSADLRDADLRDANLSSANFIAANLTHVNLSGANLAHAYLSGANLTRAKLNSTNFHSASLSYTLFAWVDLCAVEGLDTVIHNGPSSVDVKTVRLPEGETRVLFLRGAGFSDTFIDYLPSRLQLPSSMRPASLAMPIRTKPWPNASIRICKTKGYVAGLISMI